MPNNLVVSRAHSEISKDIGRRQFITSVRSNFSQLEADSAAIRSELTSCTSTKNALEAKKESALFDSQSIQSSTQRILSLHHSIQTTHSHVQQEVETRRLRFLQLSQVKNSLESKVRDLQSQLAQAYRNNEELSRNVSGLDKEKSELRSNIAALEHLLEAPGFKTPKSILAQSSSSGQLLSQGAEILEDICVMCGGPLYGKVRKCKECGGRMHGHCVTNKLCLCINCLG